MKTKIRLGVNLDHVVTLRQVRGGTTPYPDLAYYLRQAEKAGADQITLHLREDRRHIQDHDLALVVKRARVPVNLEMAVTSEMTKIALKYKPYIVCLVPEKRAELTTEGGLNVRGMKQKIQKLVRAVSRKNIRVSTFIEANLDQVKASFEVGADAVEFHTGKWVHLKGNAKEREWDRLRRAAVLAHHLGLKVHAGHGLDYKTTKEIKHLPYLEEVNIGHFLICEGLDRGLKIAIKKMKRIL